MARTAIMLGMTQPVVKDGATLQWARFLPATNAEGPGQRSAIWLQGCSIHCPGCFNPHLWAEIGGTLDETSALAERFVTDAVGAGVEGITLLGGEPFDQAAALATIAEAFRAAGLTVMTFSGYTLESLTRWAAERDDIARLLASPPDRAATRAYAERFDWRETGRLHHALLTKAVQDYRPPL